MIEPKTAVAQALQETAQKVEASLQEAIDEHVSNADFAASHGLDFLEVKNSLMLTYLIELTDDARNKLQSRSRSDASIQRLSVMKTVLDKSRGLEKKLRYQIDKLLAAGSNSTSFVASGSEDPLQYRPETSLMKRGDGADDESDEDDCGGEGNPDDGSEGSSVDADLAAARLTVAASRGKSTKEAKRSKRNDQESEDGEAENKEGVYRAPRLAAVPYNLDRDDRDNEKKKRELRRMRSSELAQALRAQYGEAPEQEDIHGGTEMGKQRESARRFAVRQEEKTRYEEDAFIRLATSRKEKQERKKVLREETSNLSAIADLGNIVRDAALLDREKSDRRRKSTGDITAETERRHHGKRKREMVDSEGRPVEKGRRKSMQPKNTLQAALFGNAPGTKKSKKRGKK